MPDILLRDIPPEMKRQIEDLAHGHKRSISSEAKSLLERALTQSFRLGGARGARDLRADLRRVHQRLHRHLQAGRPRRHAVQHRPDENAGPLAVQDRKIISPVFALRPDDAHSLTLRDSAPCISGRDRSRIRRPFRRLVMRTVVVSIALTFFAAGAGRSRVNPRIFAVFLSNSCAGGAT